MQKLTQQIVRNIFEYKDGNLYWKVPRCGIQKGKKAGNLNQNGYYNVGINQKSYKLHRIIYLYHHGYLPKYIDHIDQNPLNNKIENLRSVTKSQNCVNRKSNKNTTSKYKGVFWYKRDKNWKASIGINNKTIHIGYFINEIDAAIAYNKKAIELFGEFACLNEVK